LVIIEDSVLIVQSGRGVTLTPHPSPLLVPRSEKQSRDIPLLSLRAFVAFKKGETYLFLTWTVKSDVWFI
jgi:hypothetical protein